MEKEYNAKIGTFIEKCWNKKDLSHIDSLFAQDYTRRLNNIQIASNPKELADNLHVFFTGFPDLTITIDSSTIINNLIFIEWTFTGTNTGIFGEVQATGKKVKVSGFSKIYFDKTGKIAKENIYYNELDFLQQLGYSMVIPNTE